MLYLTVLVTTLCAGFIDAMAGGGGLITIPVWSLLLGAGSLAIGTNKLGALSAATIALIIYWRSGGQSSVKSGTLFIVCIGLGSIVGAWLNPMVPAHYFNYVILTLAPIILWLVWHKERLFPTLPRHPRPWYYLIVVGLTVGVYDGIFGPGGGTFMLLGLLSLTNLSPLQALALSKMANALSAFTSLSTYATQGNVRWDAGVVGAVGMGIGAMVGARLASQRAAQVIRPVLMVVVGILLTRIAVSLWSGN